MPYPQPIAVGPIGTFNATPPGSAVTWEEELVDTMAITDAVGRGFRIVDDEPIDRMAIVDVLTDNRETEQAIPVFEFYLVAADGSSIGPCVYRVV